MQDDLLQRAVACFHRRELRRADEICEQILRGRPRHAKALALAGVIALLEARPAAAAERLERAAALDPSSHDILSNLGTSYVQLERFAEAADAYARALTLRPDHGSLRVNLSSALKALGQYDKAIAQLEPLLAAPRADPDLLVEMANLHVLAGTPAAGVRFYRDALALRPRLAAAQRGLAYALQADGRTADALAQYRELARSLPRDAQAQVDLGLALVKAGEAMEAIAVLRRAVALAPRNIEVRTALGKLLRAGVNQWHFLMLADEARNAAYDAAIRRAVKPGDLVLDIGTGSGLLAMMAARAGAAHVYACESQPLLAEKAREIIQINGLADRVTVIPKRSLELRIGADLPRKADLLVSEIVDEVLLGEGIVRTLAHALAELVAEGAAVIPRAGAIHAMLVESPALHRRDRVTHASGFDVSAFNEFSRFSCSAAELSHIPFRPLSPPVEVFRFDFSRPGIAAETRTIDLPVGERGIAHALVTWFDLQLDEDHRVGSDPSQPGSHWTQVVHVLEQPRGVERGQVLRVTASHDTHDIGFLADPA